MINLNTVTACCFHSKVTIWPSLWSEIGLYLCKLHNTEVPVVRCLGSDCLTWSCWRLAATPTPLTSGLRGDTRNFLPTGNLSSMVLKLRTQVANGDAGKFLSKTSFYIERIKQTCNTNFPFLIFCDHLSSFLIAKSTKWLAPFVVKIPILGRGRYLTMTVYKKMQWKVGILPLMWARLDMTVKLYSPVSDIGEMCHSEFFHGLILNPYKLLGKFLRCSK